MAKNSKPRKKYKPKGYSVNVLSEVFGGMSGDHMTHLQELMVKNHKAMADIATGHGTRYSWNMIVGAVNIAHVMCDQGIGPEFKDTVIEAREALINMGVRMRTTGKLLFRGDEMRVLNEAMLCHDAQLENVRAIDIERAANEVKRRFRQKEDCVSLDDVMTQDAREATLARVA